MKKFTKACLTLSGICAVVGVIFVILGFSMGASLGETRSWGSNLTHTIIGWMSLDEDDQDAFENYVEDAEEGILTEDGDARIYTFSGETLNAIQNLDIEIEAGSLVIEKSDTQEIRIVVASDDNEVKCGVSEKTLFIKDTTDDYDWIDMWGNDGIEVKLYVPETIEFNELDVDVKAGEVDAAKSGIRTKQAELSVDAGTFEMNHLSVSKHLEVEVGAGELELGNLEAHTMELNCGIGEMSIGGKASGDISAECGMGELNLTLDDTKENFNYRISCGIGEVRLGENSYTSLGEDDKIDNHADKTMELECGVGEIDVKLRLN